MALKVLAGANEQYATRFRREARLAASIEHPHLLPVYDSGEAEGRLYLAMLLVPGGDLAGLLRRRGSLDAGGAVRIVGQVAAALDAAHQAGLVHRDLKPANVLIERRDADHAYLMDFGLARAHTDTRLTASGHVTGTVAYLAPGPDGRRRDAGQRRLRPGLRPLRTAQRRTAVPAARRVGDAHSPRQRAAADARRSGPGGHRGGGRAGHGQAARGPLRDPVGQLPAAAHAALGA